MPGIMTGDVPERNKFKAPEREPAVMGDTGLYGSVDPAIESMISGEAYDPVEMQIQSAMGRMERTGRASAARGMGRFAAQGMGGQMAQDIDSMMAGNRLQGLTDIGAGRQATKERGIAAQMGRIGQEEQIRVGRETLDLAKLDSERRYNLARRAQDIQEKYQNGMLSLQQAQLQLERMVQDANISLRKSQQRTARWPYEMEKARQEFQDTQRERITKFYDPMNVPEVF